MAMPLVDWRNNQKKCTVQ